MPTELTTPAAEVKPEAGAVTPAVTPEVKPDPAAPAATPEVKPEAEAAAPVGAPEKYEPFKLAEGATLEEATLAEFTAAAKELNLNQAQAQKLIDLSTKHSTSLVEKQTAEYNKVRDAWVNEIKADKEFGGNEFPKTIAHAKRALGKFGSPQFSEFLDQSGYGDNPELIRMLARIDKAMGEDQMVDGKPVSSNTKTDAEVIYGK